jgi:hypothetical protein
MLLGAYFKSSAQANLVNLLFATTSACTTATGSAVFTADQNPGYIPIRTFNILGLPSGYSGAQILYGFDFNSGTNQVQALNLPIGRYALEMIETQQSDPNFLYIEIDSFVITNGFPLPTFSLSTQFPLVTCDSIPITAVITSNGPVVDSPITNTAGTSSTGQHGMANNHIYNKINIPFEGGINSLSVNVVQRNPGDSIQLVLYDDVAGLPGSIIAITNPTPATLGLNTLYTLVGATLTAGDYWIGVKAQGAIGLNLNWPLNTSSASAIIDNTKSFSDPFINNPSGLNIFSNLYDVGVSINLSYVEPATFAWQPASTLTDSASLTPTAFPASATVYTITATNNYGCVGTATVLATPSNPLSITANASATNICAGESVQLSFSNTNSNPNTPALNYYWFDGSSTYSDSAIVYPSFNTTYTAVVTNNSGCQKSDTVNVFVKPTPYYYGGNYGFCDSFGVLYAIQNTSNNTFQWYKNGVLLPGENFDTLRVTSTGNYNVIVTNADGCINDTTGFSAVVDFGVSATETYTTSTNYACLNNDLYIYNTNITTGTSTGAPSNITTFLTQFAVPGSYTVSSNNDSISATGTISRPAEYSLIFTNPSYGLHVYDSITFDWYYSDTTALGMGMFIITDSDENPYYLDSTNSSTGAKSGTITIPWNQDFIVGLLNKNSSQSGAASFVLSNFTTKYALPVNNIAYYADSTLQTQLGGSFRGSFLAPTNVPGNITIYAQASNSGSNCLGAITPITYFVNDAPTISGVTVLPGFNNPINPTIICSEDSVIFIANNPNHYDLLWRFNGRTGDTNYRKTAGAVQVALQFDFEIFVTDSNGCTGSYNFANDMPPVTTYFPPGNVIVSDNEICGGESITVNYSTNEQVLFTNGYEEGTVTQPRLNTVYTAKLTDSVTGCNAYRSETVIVHSTPSIDTLSATPACAGSSYTITAVASNNTTAYTQALLPYALEPTTGTPSYIIKDGENIVEFSSGGPADGVTDAINLPFTFEYFGQDYNQIWLSSNGSLHFDVREQGNSSYFAYPLPNTLDKRAVINFALGNLSMSLPQSQMYYTIEGSAPNRKFVMNYTAPGLNAALIPIKGQVVLFEGSNNIQVSVDTMITDPILGPFTIGMQDKSKTRGFCFTTAPCGTTGVTMYKKTWLITPQKNLSNFYWQPLPSGQAFTNVDEIIVSNGTPRNLSLSLVNSDGCDTSKTITVTPSAGPTVSANANSTLICEGTTVILNGAGGLNYTWSNGITNNVATTINVAGFNIYTVTGSDAAGCTATSTIQITAAQSYGDLVHTSGGNSSTYPFVTSLTQAQPDGDSANYVGGQFCSQMFMVYDSIGGNSLGNVTGTVTTTASVTTAGGQPYCKRAFTITPTNQAGAAITLYFTQDEFNDYNNNKGMNLSMPTTSSNTDPDRANLIITKVNGGTLTTGTLVDIFPTSVVWNNTLVRWEVTFPVSSFSDFYLKTSTLATPLNVALLLSGKSTIKGNELQFRNGVKDAIEFEVQKSTAGSGFATIAAIKNNTNLSEFFYTDIAASASIATYKIVAKTTTNEFVSNTVSLENTNNLNAEFTLYPNPTSGKLSFTSKNSIKGNFNLKVKNTVGQVVMTINTNTDGGNTLDLDLSEFASGFYYVEIDVANKAPIFVGKVFKN